MMDGLGPLSPAAFQILRRSRGGAAPSGSNSLSDVIRLLETVKDLWGRKQNEDKDESLEAKSAPVHVTNIPRISPG